MKTLMFKNPEHHLSEKNKLVKQGWTPWHGSDNYFLYSTNPNLIMAQI